MALKLIGPIAVLLGALAGVGTAIFMAPAPETEEEHMETASTSSKPEPGNTIKSDYLTLDNQFIVPLVEDDTVSSMIVLSLSLEVDPSARDIVYTHEPKLRDRFLRILFDHANMGGFQGSFTKPENLDLLRTALKEVAQNEIGAEIRDVLIVDIVRQDG